MEIETKNISDFIPEIVQEVIEGIEKAKAYALEHGTGVVISMPKSIYFHITTPWRDNFIEFTVPLD